MGNKKEFDATDFDIAENEFFTKEELISFLKVLVDEKDKLLRSKFFPFPFVQLILDILSTNSTYSVIVFGFDSELEILIIWSTTGFILTIAVE